MKLDDESYLARAGLVSQGILEEIRREVRQRFPRSEFTVPDADAQSIVAYAFLEKSLPFAEKFDRLGESIRFAHAGGTAQIAAFGFRGDLKEAAPRTNRLLGQVSVLSFANSNDFVVQLKPKASGDSIVLAKVPPEPTLEATIKAIKRRIDAGGEHDSYVGSNEIVAIPLISLGVLRRYAELEDRTVENSPWREENYYVKHADQEIRFRLDETGAAVSSLARNEYAKSAPTSRPEPRAFVFDRPFLLWLQHKAQAIFIWPYGSRPLSCW